MSIVAYSQGHVSDWAIMTIEYVNPLYCSHRNESEITQSMTDEVSPSMFRAQVFPNIRA